MITLTAVNPDFSIAGQLQPEQLTELKNLGFKTIINNRPDNEESNQPQHQAIQHRAEQLGLQYIYLPVASTDFKPEEIEKMRRALEQYTSPILAFCRTGNRSLKLYQAACLL